jgi:uncharacterized protein (TIGR02145 family)
MFLKNIASIFINKINRYVFYIIIKLLIIFNPLYQNQIKMKKKSRFIFIVLFVFLYKMSISQDIKEVQIGDQAWMSENLNSDKFRNGDIIPQAKTPEEWKKAFKSKKPAWCYYNNDLANGKNYGKLYNWYAVNDPRGLAPIGWHIPNDLEWKKIINTLGGKYDIESKVKSQSGWGTFKDGGGRELESCPVCDGLTKVQDDYGKFVTCRRCIGQGLVYVTYADATKSGNGTNSSGFTALPGGRRQEKGIFDDIGKGGYWWSSTSNYTYGAYNYELLHKSSNGSSLQTSPKDYGLSIRCVKGESPMPLVLSEEIKIGDQIWMNQNLSVEKFRNGNIIPEAKTDEEWEKACNNKQPAWCYYNNDPAYGLIYGKFYNWYAVNDPRQLAPVGWHISSDSEWIKMIAFLGGDSCAGFKLKSKYGWLGDCYNCDGNGNDESGFGALPGGLKWGNLNISSEWWSSSVYKSKEKFNYGEEDVEYVLSYHISGKYKNIKQEKGKSYGYKKFVKEQGFYVRCVKN